MLFLGDTLLWLKPPLILHEHGCECEHVREGAPTQNLT